MKCDAIGLDPNFAIEVRSKHNMRKSRVLEFNNLCWRRHVAKLGLALKVKKHPSYHELYQLGVEEDEEDAGDVILHYIYRCAFFALPNVKYM